MCSEVPAAFKNILIPTLKSKGVSPCLKSLTEFFKKQLTDSFLFFPFLSVSPPLLHIFFIGFGAVDPLAGPVAKVSQTMGSCYCLAVVCLFEYSVRFFTRFQEDCAAQLAQTLLMLGEGCTHTVWEAVS